MGNVHDGATGRCLYDGDWQEGYFWGQGAFTCCDGRQFSGGWVKDKKHGKGRWIILPAKLQYATQRDDDGQATVGGPLLGENGEPIKFTDQGRVRVHEGMFNMDVRQGKGKAVLNNGDVMEGEFVEGKAHGAIKITFATGKMSYATFMHGQRRYVRLPDVCNR
jgi:hypothetical protein